VILWDVDTQVDFVLPHGKLYVPGAEETVPAMKRLVDAVRAAGRPRRLGRRPRADGLGDLRDA
jgi:nicotinamidase-related amidase